VTQGGVQLRALSSVVFLMCSYVNSFKGTYHLYLFLNPEERCDTFVGNVGDHLQDHTTQKPTVDTLIAVRSSNLAVPSVVLVVWKLWVLLSVSHLVRNPFG
jgi:hypothetical protein